MMRFLALCCSLAACCIVAAVAMPTRAAAQELPFTARFVFPVSVLCGASSEAFQEGVVNGAYATVIHVTNPATTGEVRIAKALARSFPYQDSLPPSVFVEDRLAPGAAMAIECNELRQSLPNSLSASFLSGFLVLYSDGEIGVSVDYSARPRGGEISTLTSAVIEPHALCPLTIGAAGDHVYADRICLGFAWTCDNPEALTVALDSSPRGTLALNRTEDYLLGDGSSTFCASTTDLADGSHTLDATLACESQACTLSQPFQVANTPFRLISVKAGQKRYRGSDTVDVTVILSESVDEVEADFSQLDTAFDPDNVTITETAVPGTYTINYPIDGIDNTNPPGIYPVPLRFRHGAITRSYNGLRLAYVRETDNLLNPVDLIPTTTVIGPFPATSTSPAVITALELDKSVILPLTSVIVTGTIEAPFITDQPRAEVEAAARDYTLIWREADLNSAGAYRLRPAMLTFACAEDGEQLCTGGRFTVALGFPTSTNASLQDGPHQRTLRFALVDPAGGVSDAAETDITMAVLNEAMFGGTPQENDGSSGGGTVGEGVEFRLHGGPDAEHETNALTLVLTWEGENGPGANVIPGEDDLPQTLDALDLNIGIHRAPADGHGGWFGNLGNAELLRKSNTCFSGFGLGQPSPDRWDCVCGDASDLNMEAIAYPPGVELDAGGDGAGTFGAEYYIYDSCGSQQDTTATLTAYYCGIAQQQSFHIDAHLSEEDEDLEHNWGVACTFGSDCHDPKTVPTGFNETGGFYTGFDFNPTNCADRPLVAGTLSYKAPINFAFNDPSQAGDLADPDPALDQSWSFFDTNLSESGWTDFAAPFTKIEVRLVDGSEEVVGETFTDEDGAFSLLLAPNYAENGASGLVRVEAVALSAPPYNFRVIEDLADLDDTGTEDLHRAILRDDFDPVANAGAPIAAQLNTGPDDETAKEDAAAFHILRNTVLAAQYIQSLGSFVEPFTALYDRDTALLTSTCARDGSFYSGSGRYAHIQSSGPEMIQQVCPAGQADANGVCAVACVDDPQGSTYSESRADFTYNTHMHEFFHHVTSVLTTIGPWSSGGSRATGSHFGNTGERTSLNEAIATAFGSVLASKFIYNMFGEGQPLNPTLIECTEDDLTNCDLALMESVDWLTIRNKEDIVRPGPDWQPQKDCPPGALGCGCFLGSCTATGNSCQLGYCVDPSATCTPGSQGCAVGSGCQAGTNLVEHGGFCVLPVTYSDGWTWRVLWDLLDEGEDVQPEVSHWRTSQMSTADPDVGTTYDTFGGVDQFWRILINSVGNAATDGVATDDIHPNLADLLDRWRCEVGDEAFAALNDYLVNVVEFPYHNPGQACP